MITITVFSELSGKVNAVISRRKYNVHSNITPSSAYRLTRVLYGMEMGGSVTFSPFVKHGAIGWYAYVQENRR